MVSIGGPNRNHAPTGKFSLATDVYKWMVVEWQTDNVGTFRVLGHYAREGIAISERNRVVEQRTIGTEEHHRVGRLIKVVKFIR